MISIGLRMGTRGSLESSMTVVERKPGSERLISTSDNFTDAYSREMDGGSELSERKERAMFYQRASISPVNAQRART